LRRRERVVEMSEEDLTKLLVRVDIPDLKTQKCVVLSVKDTVWAAKQVVLDKLNQDLPNNLLNYGLYLLPSVAGKLGKYMDDGRYLGEYVLHGHVPRIELRYKKRDYSIQVTLKGKDISKANSKANLRKFAENVVQGNVKKVEKLLDSGVDPNFITEDGNTPLGLACGRNANVQVIMPLLSNGAHIDFRGKEGLTPLHRAALGGNSAAIKVWICPGCLSTSLLTHACIPLLCSITIIDNSLLVNGYCKGKTYLLEI
jgi:SH3/ankyrin repeat-containing protein